jgi:hypothetical protein
MAAGDNISGEAGQKTGYRVLARKYRPKDFSDLMVGQEAMVKTLTNAFESGRIAQAYMLTGVRGVGKTTTARILARALNYKTDTIDKPTIDLKEIGVHCQAIMEGRHVDVIEMDARDGCGLAYRHRRYQGDHRAGALPAGLGALQGLYYRRSAHALHRSLQRPAEDA